MKYVNTIIICLLLVGCGNYKTEELTEIPPEVKKSIQRAVDGKHRPGVVVGLINPNGTYFYSYGTAVVGQKKELSADSQFAIGSLTKLFTAEVFQRLVDNQTLSYQTKVKDIWPDIVDGGDTELWHLASHKAALPRKIPYEAIANNDPQLLLATLKRRESLPAEYEYSNTGMAILGLSLAQVQKNNLAGLMEKVVFKPMGLTQTSYQPNQEYLVGMHQVMEPVEQRNTSSVEIARGAGGLYSTAKDLAKFVSVQLNNTETATKARYEKIGWKKYKSEDFVSYYHGGDGNGNQAFVGYRPDNKVGVVLLSNSSTDDDLQTIALHLLDPAIELPKFDHQPARKYSHEELASLVGVYSIKGDTEGNSFTFEDSNGRLIYIEKTAEGELVRRTRMLGIGKDKFQLAEMPLTIHFLYTETKNYNAIMTFQDQEYYLVKKSDN
ncbi:serine hydrolase domain-containing protein [Kangiella koreensis]|uniref:Beta-lactamase n=1 Tax=Kangiella koreensis (strain DSM 16069 / JCM 12317 / KCTC 12182 / SW-125) TaxID=523791 RepID=C7R686_KANKD|nr:serine hydrolase domain-containing protein [Kangiella koreensis]ACV25517.1 beta-lactamase [Kangiella koreensis DSM 16069]